MNISYRSVQKSDFNNLRRWRNQEKVRDLSLNRNVVTKEEHSEWFYEIQNDLSRSVWIVEDIDVPLGVIQFYRCNTGNNSCWWGSHPTEDIDLGVRDRLAVWTELEKTALDIAANEIGCKVLFCETLSRNTVVHSLHERFGFEYVSRETREFEDRVEEVIIMKRKIYVRKKMMILGSANWEVAASLYEQEWKYWTEDELNVRRIPFGQYRTLLKSDISELTKKMILYYWLKD